MLSRSHTAWAEDGNCYSPYTDGGWMDYPEGTSFFCSSGTPNRPPWSTGQCKIVGDDPLNLGFVNQGKMYRDHCYNPRISLAAGGYYYIGTYSAFGYEGQYFDGVRFSKDPDHFTAEHIDHWKNTYWTDATDER